MTQQEAVQGYLFVESGHKRDRTVCQVVARVTDYDLLRDIGPSFIVAFDDNQLCVAPGINLNPWFPTG